MTRLTVNESGNLTVTAPKLTDGEALLIYEYPSGDIDLVSWPRPNISHLRGALYDLREMGLIPYESEVELPDGKTFNIDQPHWKVGDRIEWKDPDAGSCSVVGVITKIKYSGDVVRLSLDSGWESEVLESEIFEAE